jgi:hypothetical protein
MLDDLMYNFSFYSISNLPEYIRNQHSRWVLEDTYTICRFFKRDIISDIDNYEMLDSSVYLINWTRYNEKGEKNQSPIEKKIILIRNTHIDIYELDINSHNLRNIENVLTDYFEKYFSISKRPQR